MTLTGLHILLTYECTFECDHCFVWGGPRQAGTLGSREVRRFLEQARDVPSIEWIWFEGGEPFLYYPVLVDGVRRAARLGFRVGIVTNAYWAKSVDDASRWLRPFAGKLCDLEIGSDLFHSAEAPSPEARNAQAAAERLGISSDVIRVARPESTTASASFGQLPAGESKVMFRGRAASRLARKVVGRPGSAFTACPHEDLREPGRVHVDPFGHVHVCQGIVLGNLFHTPLREICARFAPDEHPIVAPLLAGGPVELARRYGIPRSGTWADACHLCYETRRRLRRRFPEALGPPAMYGRSG